MEMNKSGENISRFILYPLAHDIRAKYKISRKRVPKKGPFKYYLYTNDESTLLLAASIQSSERFFISLSSTDSSEKYKIGELNYNTPFQRYELCTKISDTYSGIIQLLKINFVEKKIEIEIPIPYGPTFKSNGSCYKGYSKINLYGQYSLEKYSISIYTENAPDCEVMKLAQIHIDEFQIDISYPLSTVQGFVIALLFANLLC